MKIINIKKKGTNFVIEFDNNQTLTVVDVIKIDFNLYKNKVITEKALSELKEQNEIEKLFSKSVKRLLIHDYSPSKMREYLKKNGGTKSQIDEVAKNITSKIHNSPTDELNVLKLEYQKLFSSYSRKIKGKELRQKITDKLLSKGYKYSDIKLLLEEN